MKGSGGAPTDLASFLVGVKLSVPGSHHQDMEPGHLIRCLEGLLRTTGAPIPHRSELTVPIIQGGLWVGQLGLVDADAPRRWDEAERDRLAGVADLLGRLWEDVIPEP